MVINKSKYIALWIVVMTVSSLVMAQFVWMVYAQSVLQRLYPGKGSLTDVISGTLFGFWDHRGLWQNEGEIPMVLMMLFGVSAGLSRHPFPLKWLPIGLGAVTLVSLPIYVAHGSYAWTRPFWEDLLVRVFVMIVLLTSGILIDKFLSAWFERERTPIRRRRGADA